MTVISDEIKFPRPPEVERFKTDRQVDAADSVNPVIRLGEFKRRWQRRPGREPGAGRRVPLLPEAEKSVRALVDRVNKSLVAQQIMIHLLLIKEDDGYSLDVYDCTDERVCTVVRDMTIDLEDLPGLLRNLEEQSGLIVDAVF